MGIYENHFGHNQVDRPSDAQGKLGPTAEIYACLASLDVLLQHFADGSVSPSAFRRQLRGLFHDLYAAVEKVAPRNLTPVKYLKTHALLEQFPNLALYLKQKPFFAQPPIKEQNNLVKPKDTVFDSPLLQREILEEKTETKGNTGILAQDPLAFANREGLQATEREKQPLPRISLPDLSVFEKITKRGQYFDVLRIGVLHLMQYVKSRTGGVVPLGELLGIVREASNSPVRLNHLRKVIVRLAKDHLIPGLRRLESDIEIVELYPLELDQEQQIILSLASRKGWTSLEEIMLVTRWPEIRIRRLLERFETQNIARFDESYKEGDRWYFPGFFKKL